MSSITVSPVIQSLTVSETVQSVTVSAPSGSPAGAAGGDLTGTYPNPTVHRIHGNDVQAGTPTNLDLLQWNSTAQRWAHRSLSAAGISAVGHTHTAADIVAPGLDSWVMFNSGGQLAGDAGLTYDASTDTLTVGVAGSGAIVMGNGEFLSNSTDGTVRIGTSGTSATHFSMTVDGTTYGSGITLGTRRNSDGNTTAGGFLSNSAWRLGNGIDFGLGGSNWYTLSYQETGGQACATVGIVTGAQNSGSSGALVVCVNNTKGFANRVPTTDHADPTLYIYARGDTSAADYVRVNHDTTDGTIESGDGRMIVKGATAVRIATASGGFDLPATAGSNGQVLTTDGTNASWQTPTGGGGVAFDEVMRIAFIGI